MANQARKIYLCGPIMDASPNIAKDWRTRAKERLAGRFILLDPMRRNFRDHEIDSANEIVEFDLQDIRDADLLLVNYNKPSIGTSMETFYASYHLGKFVIAFSPLLCRRLALDGSLLHQNPARPGSGAYLRRTAFHLKHRTARNHVSPLSAAIYNSVQHPIWPPPPKTTPLSWTNAPTRSLTAVPSPARPRAGPRRARRPSTNGRTSTATNG
ncbi:MAG TPA: nucleoside 2-deoxyribosyltransferase [Candidatus Binataceae bacterium]